MQRECTVKIPGKIIISGEHSVLQGCPAIAAACSLYIENKISSDNSKTIKIISEKNGINISSPLSELKEKYEANAENMKKFREGMISSDKITKEKTDLLFHAAAIFQNIFGIPSGIMMRMESDIPVGSGMGSSAAASLAVFAGLCSLFQKKITKDKITKIVTECENLIHGTSSGLDPAAIISGGVIKFQNHIITECGGADNSYFFIVDTGKPDCSTGEAVERAKQNFDQEMKREFTETAENIIKSFQKKDRESFLKNIRRNEELLEELGVVPPAVAAFAEEAEKKGIAFKISGAGSIKGTGGGMGLLFGEENKMICADRLCRKYGYRISKVKIHTGKPGCVL